MIHTDILEFTAAYSKVRGWDPRRLYLTQREFIDLLMEQRYVKPHTKMRLQGADLRIVISPAVCKAIRAWDLEAP